VTWFDEFDPLTNTWRTLADAPHARDHFQAALIGDKLYAAGGRRTSASTNQVFDLTIPQVDVYDFTANRWSTLADGIPTQRGAPATAVLNGELVLIGGESGTQVAAHRETEALNPTTGTWQRLADLQQGRHGTQAIVNNEAIYVVAGSGQRGGGPELTSQEVFYRSAPTVPAGVALSESRLEGPSEVTYGQVAVTTTQSQTVRLTNSGGNQAIVVSSLTLTGSGEFSFQLPGTLPLVIPVGKSLEVPVSFRPLSGGSKSATLAITHSGSGGSKTIALRGGQTSPGNLYRINAGGPAFPASANRPFAADAYAEGGSVFGLSGSVDIANTTDDGLYHTDRYGAFRYAFPVSNGNYQVILHFTEIYWGVNGSPGGVGSRRFNVDIEGQRKLSEYDIFARAGGGLRAVQESFLVPVADNSLTIAFTNGSADQAKVSAIEILPATGGGGGFSGYYTIRARHSGKVLDVAGESMEDGAELIQYQASLPVSGNQSWLLEVTPDGYYFIKARHSGKALDVQAASQADLTRIVQYAPFAQSASQQWKIEPVSDGYYKLVARHSGKVLDVAGESREDWAQIIQYTDYAATSLNQQWQLETVSATGRLANADGRISGGETEKVSLFPNPTGDLLTVQLSFPAGQVRSTRVMDATGRQYLQNAHRGSGENQLLLSVGSLRPGLYWLQLEMGATNKVIRFSKR
jgi:hypothetical protein